MKYLYVDGCCNKKIGACSSVVDSNGNDLIGPNRIFLEDFDFLNWFTLKNHLNRLVYEIQFSDVSQQQNNGAELVAAVVGILIALEFKYKIIYSDSQLIVNSWSREISKTIKDPKKASLQRLLVSLTTLYEKKGGRLIKISGDENLADLGFHRNK